MIIYIYQIKGDVKMSNIVKYKVDGEAIELTTEYVIANLVNGGGNCSEKEIFLFMEMCKYEGLNPLIGDAYLVKYGTLPAQRITSRDAFLKKAFNNPRFRGMKSGIAIVSDKVLEYRQGGIILEGEKLVGGWCEVFIEGYVCQMRTEVSLKEYNTGKSTWSAKPSTMIQKVAESQALRKAFPDVMRGMYTSEEMGVKELDDVKPTDDVAKIESSKTDTVNKKYITELFNVLNKNKKACETLIGFYGYNTSADIKEQYADSIMLSARAISTYYKYVNAGDANEIEIDEITKYFAESLTKNDLERMNKHKFKDDIVNEIFERIYNDNMAKIVEENEEEKSREKEESNMVEPSLDDLNRSLEIE
jgi:phage recombination protein Bet